MAALRASAGAQALEGPRADGAAWTIDEAVTYATLGRRSPGRPRRGWAALTNREREVASLAAGGLTNPEIAARLFLDTDTVRKRLAGVFAKLGIRSRVDLARILPPDHTPSR